MGQLFDRRRWQAGEARSGQEHRIDDPRGTRFAALIHAKILGCLSAGARQ